MTSASYNNIQQKYIESKYRRPPNWADSCAPCQPFTIREPCNPNNPFGVCGGGGCGPCGGGGCGPCGGGYGGCGPCGRSDIIGLDQYRINGGCGLGVGSGGIGCAFGTGCGSGSVCDTCINDPIYTGGFGGPGYDGIRGRGYDDIGRLGYANGIAVAPGGVTAFDIAAGRIQGTVNNTSILGDPLAGINGKIAAGGSCGLRSCDPCGLFAPYGISPCGADNGCGPGACIPPCPPCPPCPPPCPLYDKIPISICTCNEKICTCKKKKSCKCNKKKAACSCGNKKASCGCGKKQASCCGKKKKCSCKEKKSSCKEKKCSCTKCCTSTVFINPCPPCPAPCPPPVCNVPVQVEDQDPCLKPWLEFWPWSTTSWDGTARKDF